MPFVNVCDATGKVIPSDRVKTIQPLEKGTVTSIHVVEGQMVEKGDLLITLDATETAADESRLYKELRSSQHDWLRSKAFQLALQQNRGLHHARTGSALDRTRATIALDVDHLVARRLKTPPTRPIFCLDRPTRALETSPTKMTTDRS